MMFGLSMIASMVFLLLPIFGMEESKQLWDGHYYHTHARPQFESAMKHVDRLSLEKLKNIIDIGCGSGDITAVISDRAVTSQVVGTDISEDMIAAAQELYRSKSNLVFRVLDAQKLDYNEEFDGAVSFLTLHWFKDRKAFFQGLFKALKPNGEFLITVGTPNAEIEAVKKKFFIALLQNTKLDFLKRSELVTRTGAISKEEFNRLASAAGFKDITIEEEISGHDFSSKEELANFFGTFAGGYQDIASLPQATREDFIKTAASEWAKLFPEGKISYMWANLVAKGKKPSR